MLMASRALILTFAVVARLSAQDLGQSADALLDRAAASYSSARTIRAQFEQTLTNPNTQSSHSARGEFFQRGALHFAFRFSEPAGDAIVSDGAALWIYLPSYAKGQVLKMPGEAGAALDVLTQLLTAPREHYTVTSLPDTSFGARQLAVFALAPKKPAAPFSRATLWVGRDDALLWQLETVEPSGLVRRVRFASVRTNVDIPRGALTFVVPEGVRVIDQRMLMGAKVP